MKQKMMILAGLLVMAFLMSCGKEKARMEELPVEKKDEALVVYSNSLTDGRREWLQEKAKEKGFNLEFVGGGGGEISNKGNYGKK